MNPLAGVGIGLAFLASFPLLVVASLAPPQEQVCVPSFTTAGATVAVAANTTASNLGETQLQHAATIIEVGRSRGVPDQGIVVALATALQESRLTVYANDGAGGDLAPDQSGISRSLELPHEAIGTDHGSLGIFQQQWPWWGSMEELMGPATSAELFYSALLRVPGWESMPVTVAAQAVQRSAYPSAYADDEPLARQLLAEVGEGIVGSAVDCTTVSGGYVVHHPVPPDSGYVDQRNFGNTGGSWASTHTGTDFSVACGTPVLAATSGTVIIRSDQSWAGPWLVQVSTGPGQLTTWYAHMQKINVTDGAYVKAGQRLGEVGELGNATGCHLHFEVHPRGGSIYEDPIDPSVWLANNVGRTRYGGVPTGFSRVASFNVLGHSHTEPAGKHPQMDAGPVRIRRALELFDRHGVDVVGLQEFQGPQAREFNAITGDAWGIWHSPSDTANAVAWRADVWRSVDRRLVAIPYFEGNIRQMPVVRLRHRETGLEFWVVSVHNPADTKDFPHNAAHRREAIRREAQLARSLWASTGVPVILTGDLNERASAFCSLTSSTGLVAAAGGSHIGGRCRPPSFGGIDWIFGGPGLSWSRWTVDRSLLVRRTSDHPLVLADLDLTSAE